MIQFHTDSLQARASLKGRGQGFYFDVSARALLASLFAGCAGLCAMSEAIHRTPAAQSRAIHRLLKIDE